MNRPAASPPVIGPPASALPADPPLLDAAEVLEALGVDPASGLSSAEAARRLARTGRNRLDPAAQVPAWRKLLAQFADPLIYLLLAAIVISVVAWALEGAHGVPFEAIVIALIVVANGLLGFVQERKAEQAVAALQRMAAPAATVVRDLDPPTPAGRRCAGLPRRGPNRTRRPRRSLRPPPAGGWRTIRWPTDLPSRAP
jgi:Cation transporter/ATPase, N-terminus